MIARAIRIALRVDGTDVRGKSERMARAKLSDEYQRYCLEVGHFFNLFARLEGALCSSLKLHLAANILSGPTHREAGLASAIYGSMRFNNLRDTIKRILAVEGAETALMNFVLSLLNQATHIQGFRDKLAHQTVQASPDYFDGYWFVSDIAQSRELARIKSFSFDTDTIGHASGDLSLITNKLGVGYSNRLFTNVEFSEPPKWSFQPGMLRLVPRNKMQEFQNEQPSPI